MIIVKLMGGLGNQLFQYAFGKNLEIITGAEVFFDTTSYSKNSDRNLSILDFRVDVNHAESNQIDSFFSFKNRAIRKFFQYTYINNHEVHFEDSLEFDPITLDKRKNHYFLGYWQSEVNFSNIFKLLRKEFQLKSSVKKSKFSSLINKRDCVSVHIRRGDYAHNESIKAFHGLLPKTYYLNAMNLMVELVSTPLFIIFSDDIDWVKNNFQISFDYVIFDDLSYSDSEVLIIMSKCKHQIIANSTFSWWAAWLNTNKGKIIIAPKKWFSKNLRPENLIPKKWHLL